ncbi:protease modulator HflC [Lyticum sinuosum]|uniref:Protein HflC n=1 Tax=Lyticum sinuosum TaxID=1332059 RepID=A0AAE5AH97_9RICK|nr:protease modulator HflC [Lyticum sinuosum]MDZ5761325.1 Protease modulator HflC [Lyticum sinuosum]
MLSNNKLKEGKSQFSKIITIFAMLLFIMAISSYIVDQRQMVIVTQFGNIISIKKEPGIKFHIPFIQNIIYFDNRIQNINFKASDANELVTSDQKTMRIEAFAKYKLSDPARFYQTVYTESAFKARLSSIFESTIREVIGTFSFADVLGSKREVIMEKISEIITKQVEDFGVQFIDMRITRIGLPEKARMAVYRRMETDRTKEAAEIRAQGKQEGDIIKAQTERDQVIMLAEAQKQANGIRGDGESQAAKIVLEAVEKNGDSGKEFYNYYRILQSYNKIFSNKNDILLIDIKEAPLFDIITNFEIKKNEIKKNEVKNNQDLQKFNNN